MVIAVDGAYARIVCIVGPVAVMVLQRMPGGFVQVHVIEVQAARVYVMVGRFMHVQRSGHEAERQTKRTTGQCKDLTHAGDNTPLS